MSVVERHGDLEINEDLEFQYRAWKRQKTAWQIMALVLLSALLGLFGNGPLSDAKAGRKTDKMWIEYERLTRLQSLTKIQIHLLADTSNQQELRINLNRNYLQDSQIQQITPPPYYVETGQKQITYVFRQTQPPQPTTLTFYFQPERIGIINAEFQLPKEKPIKFKQFVYP
ncbi:hypothetical protein NG798_02470 [Ancylothrix sp. C2]|uniref:hypothetical protein n=1 Tax=Ancylothrix sp. D3o TaxID=2953691 RepID=UPI0021BADE01|nr:hypothetical protein [Ancylothrix sp. D3o]MCT7948645.1 hypothetical protein [Ancylothrix sp. D3o]